jgi:thiol-disulfide isomerase/thioredoxin
MNEESPRPARGRRWLAYVVAALVALGLGVYAFRLLPEPAPGSRDSGPLLAVSLPDVDGHPQSLSQWRGRLLVVNFWATWCAPCKEEMPMFVEAQATHGAKGLQFVGIAVDDAVKVRQFAKEIGLNYPALIGGYGAMELSKTLGNSLMALPFTIVIGPQGNVVLTQLGPVRPAQLERLVADFL